MFVLPTNVHEYECANVRNIKKKQKSSDVENTSTYVSSVAAATAFLKPFSILRISTDRSLTTESMEKNSFYVVLNAKLVSL